MSTFWQLERFADAVALMLPDGTEMRYAELASKADAMAAHWSRRRSLVFIRCRNDTHTLIAYLAALRHDHVAVLVPAEPGDFGELEQAYRPDWVVDGAALERGIGGGDEPDGRAAVLLSTSGSTGSPKQVVLSQENLQANAAAIAEYLALDDSERPITTLPMYYSYGLSVINSHLQVGARLLLTDRTLVTPAFWDFFRQAGATSLAGVPTSYEILQRLHLERMGLASLRTLTQAGGKLEPERVRHFAVLAREQGWRFFVMYGQTEATARMSYLEPELAEAHPESIGRAIPGGNFRLVNGDGSEIREEGVSGELIYRGPNVMLGYAESREQLASLNSPQELKTGDLAWRDARGLYYISGRLKRIIKLRGHRIGLDELQQRIMAELDQPVLCGGVDQSLVIAHQPPVQGSVVADAASRILGIPQKEIRTLMLEQWPTTASGKICYDALNTMVENG